MPTYRQLYDKLASLSQEQLDQEIMVLPLGYTDEDAAALLRYDLLPQVLEFSRTSHDVYHYSPSDEEFESAGLADFAEDEVKEMGIADDPDYVKVCGKGQVILKIRENIQFVQTEEARVGNLDTSIMHL